MSAINQYAQIGQRPKHPGTLADYKRKYADDLQGVSEQEIREQWQELLDEYEESRQPSKDAQYYTDDGTPIVLVDDNVNPRTLKWFKAVLEDAGMYSPSNDLGMSEAEVRSMWKLRTQAFKNRPGRQTRADGLVNTNAGWDTKDRMLSDEQEQRLIDVYYRQNKGALGISALWHALNKNTDPTQPADRDGITYRDLRAWYSDQMLPNLRRNQPVMSQSKARKPRQASFQPLRYIQMDLISLIGFPDRDKRFCWNLVDESTRYSVQDALISKTARACATVFVEFMIVIKERYGRWPVPKTTLRVDNGSEYGPQFEAAITAGVVDVFENEDERFELEVVRGASNVANDQSLIELTNAQWRATTKTFLYSTQQPNNAWYGHLPRAQGGFGINMREVNSLLNSRKQAALGNQSASDVWNAAMGMLGDEEMEREIVQAAYNAQAKRAEARRGPSAAVTKPYEEGDSVRRFNMRWKKAALKSNAMKMDQEYKWGGPDDVYEITRVRGGDDGPASYLLMDSQGRRVRDGWIPHDQLIKVGEEERPPDETLDPRDYDEERRLPDGRTYFTSFPWAETA
jgi:hypothetical protein